jgi:TonB family protein
MLTVASLILPTFALAQTAPTPIDAPHATTASPANASPSSDDQNWTMAWPTPNEIIPPKPIPGGNCQSRHYPPLTHPLPKVAVTKVEFHVMPDGSIQDVKLDQSSGVEALDEATLSCIKSSWRYTPATYKGQPVEVTREVMVDWHLK